MLNHDTVLTDFYFSLDVSTLEAAIHHLENLIHQNKLPEIDYSEFMNDLEVSALKNYWQFIKTPPLHYFSFVNTIPSLEFWPIPPDTLLQEKYPPDFLPSLHSLLNKIIILAANLRVESEIKSASFARVVKSLQKYINQFIILAQQNKPLDRWTLEDATRQETIFEDHEEILPPLQPGVLKISLSSSLTEAFIYEIKMLDDNNILLFFNENIIHYQLSEKEQRIYHTSPLNFVGQYENKCLFYEESGFLYYDWKNKNWESGLVEGYEYIIPAPEYDVDYIFNFRRRLALSLLEPMDRVSVKILDTSGNYVLLMDKETNGGIYDLKTGWRKINTKFIDWHANESELFTYTETSDLGKSQATALWCKDEDYKILAHGKLIVNNCPTTFFYEDVLAACFSPSGEQLLLFRKEDCLMFDINKKNIRLLVLASR